MATYNLCMLGFGNVGRALARHLLVKTPELRERYGIEWRLTGVATRRMGWLADAGGLDVRALLAGREPAVRPQSLHNVRDWLAAAQADVLFELTSLNPQTGLPAIDHIRAALEYGAHAITANKGTVVHGYKELQALAQAKGRCYLFEATVLAGAPFFSLFRETLPALTLLRFRGILNSTTNVIIAEMEQGKSFDEAVKKAQEIGIAETDPAADIDGWDATVKVCAIATVLMDTPLKVDDVQREGIRGLSAAMVQEARALGRPFKFVQQIERVNSSVLASVGPQQLAPDDPLVAAGPASLLAHVETDLLPGLTITGHVPPTGTAGPDVTAYDVLADFIRAVSPKMSS
jgi:homoserine dehydrogenase